MNRSGSEFRRRSEVEEACEAHDDGVRGARASGDDGDEGTVSDRIRIYSDPEDRVRTAVHLRQKYY